MRLRQKSRARRPRTATALLVWLQVVTIVRADDLDALCASRRAIEPFYYKHRLDPSPPFENVAPAWLIELVRKDLRKEAALKPQRVNEFEEDLKRRDAENAEPKSELSQFKQLFRKLTATSAK